MPKIEVNDIELTYEDTEAEGPPVVFVHGLGGSSRVWDAQLFASEDHGFRGIAYDQRGHGRSDKPPGPYSVEQWTADLMGLLDALELEEAALVGHSVGCMVAEHAAVALGDKARALAVCGGVLRWPPEAEAVFAQRAELARAGKLEEVIDAVITTGLSEKCRTDRADVTKRMRELLEANDAEAYAEAVTATAAAEMLDPKQLRCPVLAFAGSEDPVTPPSESEAIAAAVPKGDNAVVEGAAHWCMLEDPEGFNSILFEFLSGIAT